PDTGSRAPLTTREGMRNLNRRPPVERTENRPPKPGPLRSRKQNFPPAGTEQALTSVTGRLLEEPIDAEGLALRVENQNKSPGGFNEVVREVFFGPQGLLGLVTRADVTQQPAKAARLVVRTEDRRDGQGHVDGTSAARPEAQLAFPKRLPRVQKPVEPSVEILAIPLVNKEQERFAHQESARCLKQEARCPVGFLNDAGAIRHQI